MDIPNVFIRLFEESDLATLVNGFAEAHWPKPRSLFEKYDEEQKSGERLVWVAFSENQLAGYITLKWTSEYGFFKNSQIPEIMDFNVLPNFREQGIGSALLVIAEQAALQKSNVVGIGVGLYDGYGAAQKLYIKRGYIPTGQTITYNYQPLEYGSQVILDDDLVLWFTKQLSFKGSFPTE